MQQAFSRARPVIRKFTVVLDVAPGILVGAVFAFVTALLLITAQVHAMQTTVNGWTSTMSCGKASNGPLLKAACTQADFAINLPQEAMYWTTTVDGTGQALNGSHDYILHFPPGGLPPNNGFWSLTMTIAPGFLVANPSNRYNVGDRSGLAPNADGSVDIYIQHTAPAGREANWLPSPDGNFLLWFRVYQPGAAILSGAYHLPPVVEAH